MLPLLREENPKYVQHYFGYFILLSFLIPNRHTSLILFYISYTWVEIHVCLQQDVYKCLKMIRLERKITIKKRFIILIKANRYPIILSWQILSRQNAAKIVLFFEIQVFVFHLIIKIPVLSKQHNLIRIVNADYFCKKIISIDENVKIICKFASRNMRI